MQSPLPLMIGLLLLFIVVGFVSGHFLHRAATARQKTAAREQADLVLEEAQQDQPSQARRTVNRKRIADDIVREMRDSIAGLIPTQKFHIVLARPERSRNSPPATRAGHRPVQEGSGRVSGDDSITFPSRARPTRSKR